MKKTGLLAILTAGALMLTGCKTSEVAMQIGDVKVTTGDIAVLMDQYVAYGYDFDTAKKVVTDSLEDAVKIGELAEAMEIELDDEAKESIIVGKAQYAQMAGGLEAYKAHLKEVGSSMEFIEAYVTAMAAQAKVDEKVDEKLGDAEPTDDELKTYFVDGYYRAKHILVEKPEEAAEGEEAAEAATEAAEEGKTGKELADELLERAKNGEDFDAMVAEYSTDPGSESNPDGYIFTDGEMVKEFEDCVKSLEPGEFGICESDYGYHIIQKLPLSADEAKFEEWFTTYKDAVSTAYTANLRSKTIDELCAEYGIEVTVNQEVIDAFTEDMYTPLDTSAMMGMQQ